MTLQNTKTILFATLVLTLMIPLSAVNVNAEPEFQVKTKFRSEQEFKTYLDDLGNVLKSQYHEIKELKKSNDPKITRIIIEKTAKFESLKNHGISLLKEKDPSANPTGMIEDEYFDMVEQNNGKMQEETIKESPKIISTVYQGTAPIHLMAVTTSSIETLIGYDAPCLYAPIFVCSTDASSWIIVKTSDPYKLLVGYTKENNSWMRVYQRVKTISAGTYDGYVSIEVRDTSNRLLYSSYMDWAYTATGSVAKKYTDPTIIYPYSGCGCSKIPSGSVLNGLAGLT
ncbi:MAG: hypothetical protein HZC29_06980 [Thaumarchaeota archaeon]|nr:hypothetical protein [Nitrososphaerota archaeon]